MMTPILGPRVTIFVPAYNEVDNLEGTVEDIVSAADILAEYEIIVVDDGSTDGTGALADQLAATRPGVRVIHTGVNRGLASGYRAALTAARLPYFTFVPGDGEVNRTSIRAILCAVGTADIVVPYHANPEARQWHRRVLTGVSTRLINALFNLRLRYFQGPCVYRTEMARSLPTTTAGFFFLAEMLIRALSRGQGFVEVGLQHQERAHGRSKAVSLRNIARALAMIIRLWWTIRVRKRDVRPKEVPA